MPQPKKYFDEYRAQVVDVEDPKKLMRVQVRVFSIFEGIPDSDLPWATYKLPLGSRSNDGGVCPVQKGDLVWVRFDAGDSRAPILVGACAHMPGGKPNLGHEQWAGPDKYIHKRAEDEPQVPEPEYHKDVAFKQHDALIQLCKDGSTRITQLSSGTAVEITPDGTVLVHGEKQIFMSAPEMIRLTCGESRITMEPANIKLKSPRIDLN